jgi:hypothetical protein
MKKKLIKKKKKHKGYLLCMNNEIGCKMNNIDAIFSIDENQYVKFLLCKFKLKFESISPFST